VLLKRDDLNNLGAMIYDLCAETVVSMREQQLSLLKILECQQFNKKGYSD